MIKAINTEHLPLKDLAVSGLIIFIMSTIIANFYNPLWGLIYAISNIITLYFLGWLYQDSWSDTNKLVNSYQDKKSNLNHKQ